MENNDFLQLLDKIQSGSANSEEIRLYNQCFNNFQNNKDWNEDEMGNQQEVGEMIKIRVFKGIHKVDKVFRIYKWMGYAAAAVVLIGISILLYTASQPDMVKSVNLTKSKTGNETKDKRVTLKLADGSIIALDSVLSGKVAKQEDVEIRKTTNGQIVYKVNGQNTKSNLKNTITTPRGTQFQVTLPDGSKVWLNAESSLTYPIEFNGNERLVELKGEAYFEVAKNKKQPFIVNTQWQDVRVLGTHFNVNAYENDQKTITTLFEGRVQVKNSKNKNTVVLQPGEQAQLILGKDQIPVSRLNAHDLEEIIAWKNGYFSFVDEDIISISKKLSRWYDVDFVFEGSISEEEFNGTISNSKKLRQVLNMLQSAGNVKFDVKGRRVIVMH